LSHAIAAIDIGTNSIHMIVVADPPDLSFEVIRREKEKVPTGAGGLDGRAPHPGGDARGTPRSLRSSVVWPESHKVDESSRSADSAPPRRNRGEFLPGRSTQADGHPSAL
jgi:hypothetical protein